MPQKENLNKDRFFRRMRLVLPNGYKIPIGIMSLSAESETIHFSNGCPKCHSNLNKVDFCKSCQEQIDSKEMVKLYYGSKNDKPLIFTKEEIKTINQETTKDIRVIGYGEIKTINPMNFGSSYALLPDLNEENDLNYRRLLYALKFSNSYLVVNYGMNFGEHTAIYNGTLIYYKDENGKEIILLTNLKDSKPLEQIQYTSKAVALEQYKGVIDYIRTIENVNYSKLKENIMNLKKLELIQLKLEGKPIEIEQKEEEVKPTIDIFAVNNTAQIEG